jgi:transposase-like protein
MGCKLSYEERLKLTCSYLNREASAAELCQQYGISRSYLSRLAKRYRSYGEKGMDLAYMTPSYKRQLVERHLKGGESLDKLAAEAGIMAADLEKWLKAYKRSGFYNL